MLIGFTGPAGVGKDEAARQLGLALGNYSRYAFAKPIKDALAAMGFPEPATRAEKEAIIPNLGVSWRHMAQTLGTEWGRNSVRPDLWLWLAKEQYAEHRNLMVTDVRFENEAAWVREVGGLMVHVYGRETTVTGQEATHASEAGVAILAGAYLLPNTGGRAELRNQVMLLAEHIREL
jgi:hypothetical protein